MISAYRPHAKQAEFHRSTAKRKFVQAGRRGGKSRAAVQEILRQIEVISKKPVMFGNSKQKMTAEQAGLVPDIHIWTVAPYKTQMQQIWNEMQAFIPEHLVSRGNPYSEGTRGGGRGSGFKNDELHVWLVLKDAGGHWLKDRWRRVVFWEMKSADNDVGLQSAGLDILHITESQEVSEKAWNKVIPTVGSAGREGLVIAEGIPPTTPSHWFARNFKRAMIQPTRRRAAFRWTYLDNPLQSEEQHAEILEDKETMLEEDWRRLYLAEQPEGSGQFFKKVDVAMRGDEASAPDPNRHYVAGLDLGRSNDATVMVIKDRQSRHSVSAVELNRTDWNLQIATIKSEARRWNVEEIYMDSTGFGGQIALDAMYEELLENDIPVVGYNFTPQKKYQLFLDYRIALEHENVSFPPHWNKLADQLRDIEHTETYNRGHIFKTVSLRHDDWVDAETLALMACDPARASTEDASVVFSKPSYAPLRDGDPYIPRNTMFAEINALRARNRTKMPVEAIINGEEVLVEVGR